MFSNRSTASLIRAAQAFKAERAHRVAQEANAQNVDATVRNGVVYFNRKALGLSPTSGSGDFRTTEISEQEARRLGVLEIDE
jgi:hypothetical protein